MLSSTQENVERIANGGYDFSHGDNKKPGRDLVIGADSAVWSNADGR
jgi:hypothetical protein